MRKIFIIITVGVLLPQIATMHCFYSMLLILFEMKRLLTLLLLTPFLSIAQTSITPLDCVEPFYHGVASGDPLSDAVIIWTRVTPDDFSQPVPVSYRMATDTGMVNVVANGSMLTDNSRDFTVKFDVTGLQPDTYYYYEFESMGQLSARGRTKTAPVGDVDSLRFAIVSCANLESGYFNVYQAVKERNDVEAILMLGDYIYEYEEGGYAPNTAIDRVFDPSHETVSLDDYRLRYGVYHLDQSLQRLHQNFPWICVWDDHESANDSYTDGAENHNGGEGLWSDRKLAAQQAYFEWLPIRPKAQNNYEIYRSFEYGDLMHLMMVDTRLHGRNEQGVNESDPNRTMLGTDQYTWLESELDSNDAQWKVLGNQVVFAPITIFGVPINDDAWDGYPAERQNLMDHINNNDIENFTVLTGDIHTSWAFDLEDGSDNVGVEFVTPSVTSPGAPLNVGSILTIENPHIEFVELTEHGFIILDVNEQRIQADWFFINTIDNVDPTYSWAKSLYSDDGQMQLQNSNNESIASAKYDVDLAPLCPRVNTSSIDEVSEIGVIALYPNPVSEELNIHFLGVNDEQHIIEIVDLQGQIVKREACDILPMNSTIKYIEVASLHKGMYIVNIKDAHGNRATAKFLKK